MVNTAFGYTSLLPQVAKNAAASRSRTATYSRLLSSLYTSGGIPSSTGGSSPSFNAGPVGNLGATGRGGSIVNAAKRYLGQPYVYGGLDCSGLVQRAYAAVGIRLPRVSVDQARQGKVVPGLAYARPGDIIQMNSRALGAGRHVAIYAGGGKIIEAPRTGLSVRVRSVSSGEIVRIARPY